MTNDVVCSVEELLIARNSVSRYVDFLAECMESYMLILNQIQSEGIQDELIGAELSNIVSRVQVHKNAIVAEGKEVSVHIAKSIDLLEDTEDFMFPYGGVSNVINVLNDLFERDKR